MQELYTLERLEWDSNLIEKNVGRLILYKDLDEDVFVQMKREIERFDLLYIFNQNNSIRNNRWVSFYTTAFLADVNVQLTKKLRNKTECRGSHEKNQSFEIVELLNKEGVSLYSEGMFKESRFVKDPLFGAENAETLYRSWLSNALKNRDKKFLVALENNQIIGFLEYSFSTGTEVVIELFYIVESFQGRGIGTALLGALDSLCIRKGIEYIHVGTQVNNVSAQNIYQKNGYYTNKVTSIYHLWK